MWENAFSCARPTIFQLYEPIQQPALMAVNDSLYPSLTVAVLSVPYTLLAPSQ